MPIHTNMKFTAEQLDMCAPDKAVCGCGCVKDVIDVAAKLAAPGLRDNCATWNILVYETAIMLIANAQFAKLMSNVPPELEKTYTVDIGAQAVEDWRGSMNVQSGCIIAANEKYVADIVDGPIREALLDLPVSNRHEEHGSKQ